MELFELNNPLPSIELALEGLSMRQKTTAGNIANINTPDYKKREVTFEAALEKVIKGNKLTDIPMTVTNPAHFKNDVFKVSEIAAIKPQVGIDQITDLNANNNNVDIDAEMVYLAQTGMKFKGVAEMAKRQFDNLRGVIRS